MKLLIKLAWYSLSEKERNQVLQFLPILQQDAFQRLVTGKRDQYPPSFNSKKCIFVHIPKTAGTSVTDALFGTPRPRHRPLQWYEAMEPELYKEYFKFAFVRNPWDRLVSGYHYVVNKKPKKQSEIEWINFFKGFDSFDDFVTRWLNEENIERHILTLPQHRFVINKFGMLGLDFVGRYETLQKDFPYVCERLGVACELPYENKAPRKEFRNYYTSQTRDIVAKVYTKDIEMFGYDFD